MPRFRQFAIASALFLITISRTDAQAPKDVGNSAQITDQIERLVTRPNAIAIDKDQRRVVDSLKITYLKEMRALEAASHGGDQMANVMRAREKQLAYRDIVRKLMHPSHLEDFEKNAYEANFGTKGRP